MAQQALEPPCGSNESGHLLHLRKHSVYDITDFCTHSACAAPYLARCVRQTAGGGGVGGSCKKWEGCLSGPRSVHRTQSSVGESHAPRGKYWETPDNVMWQWHCPANILPVVVATSAW